MVSRFYAARYTTYSDEAFPENIAVGLTSDHPCIEVQLHRKRAREQVPKQYDKREGVVCCHFGLAEKTTQMLHLDGWLHSDRQKRAWRRRSLPHEG